MIPSATLMACIAGLLHLPPANPPPVIELPLATIRAVKSGNRWAQALYADGAIFVYSGIPFRLLAHELAHATQDAAGLPYNTPEAEAQAYFVQRHAETWCREP